ncbi:hypothetical protein QWY85_02065 [Neolewinella lacunae]|uniref:Uncharacterized protein n=1 Tax=Neolewinella lacunae TaxID=1517758 RepID=A0A923PQJ1_9BACT|nr:hypothetical protein [Neolewinella lacunae]MBC6996710.1 hypothetical protein [Neolewinella lacunae]MDN3633425.1 hypothetical protein [Neolewinella lacunae]
MNYTIERTDEEIIFRFPNDMTGESIKKALEHFQFTEVMSKSQATPSEIDSLVDDVRNGIWERTKLLLKEEPGFEHLMSNEEE